MTVEIRGVGGAIGADDRVLVLYTGGTIGMAARSDGALVPQDVATLATHLRPLDDLSFGITVAAFSPAMDSAAIRPQQWIDIADAIVELASDHFGIVVLHGTDTMAYTASALSFLLEGVDRPIVITGSQRPLAERRSDAERNLGAAGAFATLRDAAGGPAVPEVSIAFNDLLLRGNRSRKVHASSFAGFGSPNLAPLARAGVGLTVEEQLIRASEPGPMRRASGLCTDVAALRLHPALDQATLEAVLSRPGLRGLVLEAYGAGNGPTEEWFLGAIRRASDDGIVVLVTTQCDAGGVHVGQYATGAALFGTGAVPGGDMTFEAALTKLMALLDRNSTEETAVLLQQDLAGELTELRPIVQEP
jgi:L-asparaginase